MAEEFVSRTKHEMVLRTQINARAELVKKIERLQVIIDVLLPVAQTYVDAFRDDEKMTMPERLRLQQVEDILNDPENWSPADPIGGE